jgi:hypothetical protein
VLARWTRDRRLSVGKANHAATVCRCHARAVAARGKSRTPNIEPSSFERAAAGRLSATCKCERPHVRDGAYGNVLSYSQTIRAGLQSVSSQSNDQHQRPGRAARDVEIPAAPTGSLLSAACCG